MTDGTAFADGFLKALNDGALCLMASIGHRTGLFDAMHDQPPSTPGEIAARAGLNERYVREWLGAMTTARVVDVNADSTRFHLPAAHAAWLTRAAGADNLATFAQYIAMLGSVEDEIVECFRKGGGVPYEKYPRFHRVMAEDSGLSVLNALESHILPLVPGLAERLHTGVRMLDVGCGSGRIVNRMAEMFPASRFVGMDLSMEAIGYGRAEAAAKQLRNVEFVAIDLSDFDRTAAPSAFDVVTTFDAVHDQSRPLNVLAGIHRSLAADGVYLMQEIKGSSHVHNNLEHPLGTFLYAVSCFQSVEKHELAHDIQNNWYVVRK
jgi:2-polyprenyl-3-methyl-5-hydroxy-6-metoxy-1,4-benzoquinol methylase